MRFNNIIPFRRLAAMLTRKEAEKFTLRLSIVILKSAITRIAAGA